MYQAVKKLLVGDTQTDTQDRQNGDLISLLSFVENRLKKSNVSTLVRYLKPTTISPRYKRRGSTNIKNNTISTDG
jgi:hypothetical protein